jgi:ribosomal-protein-alanine N-acetyltransferase
VIVRPAVADDARPVRDLEAMLFGPDAWSLPSVLAELTGPDRRAVVAVEDDVLVGYAVTMGGAEVVDLQRIAVRPEHRRRGVAAALLRALLDAAVAAGAQRMLLEVSVANTAALGFYERAGFAGIGRRRRYYRDGSDAMVLARDLP